MGWLGVKAGEAGRYVEEGGGAEEGREGEREREREGGREGGRERGGGGGA
jgi:hypothetical protein